MSIVYKPSISGLDAVSLVTIGTANGLSITSAQALSLALSSTSTTGALSNTDWNTFNSKQAADNYITALTGDATASGPGSAALTLATVNANTGNFGSSTAIPTLTLNAKGLVVAASTNTINAPAGQLTGNTLASGVTLSSLTSVGTLTVGAWNANTIGVAYGGTGLTSGTSGGVIGYTASGTLASSIALATNGIVLGGGAGATPTSLTTNSSTVAALISGGTNTAPSWGTLAIGGGGTGQTTKAAAFDALSPMTTGGDLIYGGASGTGTRLANGSSGQVLTSAGTTAAPVWQTAPVPTMVGCSYTGSATSINGTPAKVTFSTSVFDTHSAYSSGTFTVPTAQGGYYLISASIFVSFASSATDSAVSVYIYKGGVQTRGTAVTTATLMTGQIAIVSAILPLVATDTIDIRAAASQTTPTILNNAVFTYFSIAKIAA